MLRRIMRSTGVGGGRRSDARTRSIIARRKRPGAGGRIASAGASATAPRTARNAPASAAPKPMTAPIANGMGPGRKSRKGK
jgi:hypothetical protein